MSMPYKRRLFVKRCHPAMSAGKIALAIGAVWMLFGCALPHAQPLRYPDLEPRQIGQDDPARCLADSATRNFEPCAHL